ncbi:MAG: hypothetical protein HKN04_14295 [Rhodothermaceae bacterium]|nr:hypothetical protein [Rhodothermaceae bacterium]
MALDRNTLRDDLLAAFEAAKEEEWGAEEVAGALADAIDAYVRGGRVSGLQTSVSLDTVNGNPATGAGTGTQTGSIALQ